MIKKFLDSIKYLKLKDIGAIFIFIIMFFISIFYKVVLKMSKKEIWLICESKDTANDNGYYFFKYMRENHPEVNCYYAIDKKCKAYQKVKEYGNIIQYESLKHWLYYLCAKANLSNQKSGNPNPAVFYVLNVYLNFKTNRVFLQHGITINKSNWLKYENTKFDLFVCGAKIEYEYLKENLGYPYKNIIYTGFPRYDTLKNEVDEEKIILLMPTWRIWIGRETNNITKTIEFKETNYYKIYNSLLQNKKLNSFLKKENIKLYFFQHKNMQKFTKEFKSNNDNVIMLTNEEQDIQALLNKSSMLITDYSSVSMDFGYLHKPIYYYQFDREEYRKKQLQEGYFSYKNNGFGEVIQEEQELVEKIIKTALNNFKVEPKYKNRVNKFFELQDTRNSERIYDKIQKRIKEGWK